MHAQTEKRTFCNQLQCICRKKSKWVFSQPKAKRRNLTAIHISDFWVQSACFPVLKKGTFYMNGNWWSVKLDCSLKIRRRLSNCVFRSSRECVTVWVCMCHCILGRKGTWETFWEEGTKATEEEEDIIDDFPPCLHYLKHLHLVFLRFPHKAALCMYRNRRWDQMWDGYRS